MDEAPPRRSAPSRFPISTDPFDHSGAASGPGRRTTHGLREVLSSGSTRSRHRSSASQLARMRRSKNQHGVAMAGMTLSYAQRLEDYHLASAFGHQASGFYVDLGAGHPVADNVSYWFYLQGWRGVVVEPQAHLLDLYRHLRPRDVAV